MAISMRLSERTTVTGLSKTHGAQVILQGVNRFNKNPGDFSTGENPVLPLVALFEHHGFKGGSELTFAGWSYVGDWWFGKISSVMIVSGTWEFFSEKDFRGNCWIYGPGLVDEISSKIASFRRRSP